MTVAPPRRSLAPGTIEEVEDALRRAGHRVSAPARRVLDALLEADGPVSAERIAAGPGGRGPAIDLASAYRNLERLEAVGAVAHVHLGHGPGLYVVARDGDREYLVCERCGQVTSVAADALDPVRATVRRRFGYDVRFTHFPLHGHCADCARALATPEGGRMPEHDRDHELAHSHEHRHGDVVHSHPHARHEHEHVEHEHEHSHGDRVHSHRHAHEADLEHEHDHAHD
jgi:Fur family transcriptional regulator, ferric uptake regulator